MATIEPYPSAITTTKAIYTFEEAIEYMKFRDRYATTAPPIQWVSVRTGKPVSIGYT